MVGRRSAAELVAVVVGLAARVARAAPVPVVGGLLGLATSRARQELRVAEDLPLSGSRPRASNGDGGEQLLKRGPPWELPEPLEETL
eukprot:9501675-Pyramimonas_sp.AAC.1